MVNLINPARSRSGEFFGYEMAALFSRRAISENVSGFTGSLASSPSALMQFEKTSHSSYPYAVQATSGRQDQDRSAWVHERTYYKATSGAAHPIHKALWSSGCSNSPIRALRTRAQRGGAATPAAPCASEAARRSSLPQFDRVSAARRISSWTSRVFELFSQSAPYRCSARQFLALSLICVQCTEFLPPSRFNQ